MSAPEAPRGAGTLRPLFSHASEHWATPKDVYAKLDAEFGFTLDPCPLNGDGGLTRSWRGERVYCNPPYGRGVASWLAKASEAELAVYLLPARTDTVWWHEYAMQAQEIRFLRGRLRFGDAKAGAPFPSVVLVFRKSAPAGDAARANVLADNCERDSRNLMMSPEHTSIRLRDHPRPCSTSDFCYVHLGAASLREAAALLRSRASAAPPAPERGVPVSDEKGAQR